MLMGWEPTATLTAAQTYSSLGSVVTGLATMPLVKLPVSSQEIGEETPV